MSVFISFDSDFMLILILSGDIELNPGPVTHKIAKYYIRGLRSKFLDLQSCARNYDFFFYLRFL